MRLFLDSSIVVEVATSDDAVARLKEFCQGHSTLVSSHVLAEVFNALTRKKGRPAPLLIPREAENFIRTTAAVHELAPLTPEDVLEGLRLRSAHQLSFWDSLNVATAIRVKCDWMLTIDLPSGSLNRELICVNPLTEQAPVP